MTQEEIQAMLAINRKKEQEADAEVSAAALAAAMMANHEKS